MSKSNLNESGWLIPRGKNMPVIPGDAIKSNCIKTYVPSVPKKGYSETEQTQIRRRRTRRLIRNFTLCLQAIIFEIESK